MKVSPIFSRDPYNTTNDYPIISAYLVSTDPHNLRVAFKYRVPAKKAGDYSDEPSFWYPLEDLVSYYGDTVLVCDVNGPVLVDGLPQLNKDFVASCRIRVSASYNQSASIIQD